jgi:endonuclease YncB( thermonuclease family)
MQDGKGRAPFNLIHAAMAFGVGVYVTFLVWSSLWTALGRPFLGPSPAFEGKCTRIIDADTIVITSQREGDVIVHLDSLAAPLQGERFFSQAVQFTTKILLHQDVTVQPLRGRGDVVGWVYARPRCFNNEIVSAGYARASLSDRGDEPLKALQDEARKAGRGLWSQGYGAVPGTMPGT